MIIQNMNSSSWTKFHIACPYCNQKLKLHVILKKDHSDDPVSERTDCQS